MFILSKPIDGEPIPQALLAYVGQKLRNDVYHIVMSAFKESNLTQAELATKVGMDRGQLNRLLSSPGNWTLDTGAKLLFAINGSLLKPLAWDLDDHTPANMTQPEWLATSKRHVEPSAAGNVIPPSRSPSATGTTAAVAKPLDAHPAPGVLGGKSTIMELV